MNYGLVPRRPRSKITNARNLRVPTMWGARNFRSNITNDKLVIAYKRYVEKYLKYPVNQFKIYKNPTINIRNSSKFTLILNDRNALCLFFFFQFVDMIHDHGTNNIITSSWNTFMKNVNGEFNSSTFPSLSINGARIFVLERIKIINNKIRSIRGDRFDIAEYPLDILLISYLPSITITNDDIMIKGYQNKEKVCLNEMIRFVEKKTNTNSKILDMKTPTYGALAYDKQVHKEYFSMVSMDMTNTGSLKAVLSNHCIYVHLSNLIDPGRVFQLNRSTPSKLNYNKSSMTNQIYFDMNRLSIQLKSINASIFEYTLSSNQSKNGIDVTYKRQANKQNKFTEAMSAKSANTKQTYQAFLRKFMGDYSQICNCLHKNIYFASGDKMACVGYLVTWILFNGNRIPTSNNLHMYRDCKLIAERLTSKKTVPIAQHIVVVTGVKKNNITNRQINYRLRAFKPFVQSANASKLNTSKRKLQNNVKKSCMEQCIQKCQQSKQFNENKIPPRKRLKPSERRLN